MTIKGIETRDKDYRISCQERIPSTLLINRESRKVALKRYSLRFATFENVYEPPTYFDFSRDIVYLENCYPTWWKDFNEDFNSDLGLVQRIITENAYWWFMGDLVKPFSNICGLGIARANSVSDHDIPVDELQGLISLLNQPGDYKGSKKRAERLKKLKAYFLNPWDLFSLELGNICWER